MANLVIVHRFAKVFPSKYFQYIEMQWKTYSIRQSFTFQLQEQSDFAKVSPHQHFALYSISMTDALTTFVNLFFVECAHAV